MERHMGNERKVNEIVQRSKEIFLPDELRPEEEQQVYSLNDEFAKTRKNRNFTFGFVVLGFLVLIIGLTYFGSHFIETFREEHDVDIAEFDDLRLRDLFDDSSKYQTELNTARDGLERMKFQMQEDILSAKNDSARARENIFARQLSSEDREVELKKISDREETRVQAIRSSYQRKISARESEISDLRKKISETDKDMKVNVQKADSIMGNYQKLHNIKMERQKAHYEGELSNQKQYYERYIQALILKYNPVFTSPAIKEIFASTAGTGGPKFTQYSDLLRKEGIYSRADFDRVRKNFQSFAILMDRMLHIPYENSVPPSLRHIDSLPRAIIDAYEKMIANADSVILAKNKVIQNYRFAIEHYGRVNPENGFIIDPRDTQSIRVQLAKTHSVRSGDIGLVFREDDEYIAKLEFTVRDTEVTARLVELATNKTLKPFDKILINYKKEPQP